MAMCTGTQWVEMAEWERRQRKLWGEELFLAFFYLTKKTPLCLFFVLEHNKNKEATGINHITSRGARRRRWRRDGGVPSLKGREKSCNPGWRDTHSHSHSHTHDMGGLHALIVAGAVSIGSVAIIFKKARSKTGGGGEGGAGAAAGGASSGEAGGGGKRAKGGGGKKKKKYDARNAFIELVKLPAAPAPAAAAASTTTATSTKPKQRRTRRPLDGLKFAIKDIFDVRGRVTGFGSPAWAATHAAATVTAHAVTALQSAGAAGVGMTHMDEFAYSINGENAHYGTPENPNAAGRIPGGSSSGSAVAVAAALEGVDFALGTDSGGSVRIPASYNGCYGFRPTHGVVSVAGVVPFAKSFDTVGWFARKPEARRAVRSFVRSFVRSSQRARHTRL